MNSTASHQPSSHWWPIIAAAVSLIVVHGFGRFVYTPLLPLLVDDGLITLSQAASLATWNYVGYLSGAMLALFLYQRGHGRITLALMLTSNALITLLQVFVSQYEILATLRLLNGIGNGVVFVLAPALVLEWLVTQQKAQLSGLMYLGVGIGLLSSSALVELSAAWLAGPQRPSPPFRWRCGAAGICIVYPAMHRPGRVTIIQHSGTAPARRYFWPMPVPG